jgi:hypothetical protein
MNIPINHQTFYIQAGDFLGHVITSQGESPRIIYTCEFHYQNGRSSFDGREWKFTLFTEEENM